MVSLIVGYSPNNRKEDPLLRLYATVMERRTDSFLNMQQMGLYEANLSTLSEQLLPQAFPNNSTLTSAIFRGVAGNTMQTQQAP